MASSLSNIVNNLADRIHEINCKYKHNDKQCEDCGIKYKDCDCFLQYTNFMDHLIEYKYLCCKQNYKNVFGKNLKNDCLIHTNSLNMLSISLFYCYEKAFTLINIQMIEKNSFNIVNWKRFLHSPKFGIILMIRITHTLKEFSKIYKKNQNYQDLFVQSYT